MLLRVCLILAILAGLGVIGVSQFVLKPQIEGIIETRTRTSNELFRTQGELKTTKKTLKETSEELAKTKSTLEETKGQLAATTTKYENEQKRANGLQEDKNRLSAALKSAQNDLFAWTNSGVRVEDIPALVTENKNLKNSQSALQEENKLFKKKWETAEQRIKDILGGGDEPVVPRTVHGKVLVVDPKWDFVVLDVGSKNDLLAKSVLLVSRNSELVAKVRVMNVQDQRSIANVLPGWKLKDIMEGDVVLAP